MLLVEDHPDVAEMTLVMLRMFDCVAEHATSVREARVRLDGESFDLLLADYRLPDGNGMDVIRAAADRPQIKRILLTAYGTALNPAEPGDPPFRVIGKPIEIDRLQALLDEARSLRHGARNGHDSGDGPGA